MKTNTSIFKVIFLAIIIPFLVVGCSNGSNYKESDMIALDTTGETEIFETVTDAPATTSGNEENIPTQAQRKIIRNATIRMKVNNIEDASRLARNYALQYAGYISDERMENNSYSKENRFTVRVPQQYFDVLMDSISSLSIEIDSKNVSTIDVTEEYVDIESRLNTKREVKERYESILRAKAKTVEEVLNAEEKIRILQEEIEVAEGRLRYLTSNVSYSTIQVDVYEIIEEVEIKKESEFLQFFDDIKGGLRFGLYFIELVIVGLFHIWPLFIVGIIVRVIYVRRKKIKNNK